jgi:hypothetical protein
VKENVKTGVTSIPPPTPAPSETPPPPSRTPPPSPTAVIQPTPTPQPLERHRVEGRDFFMMFLGLVVTLVAGYQLGTRAKQPTRGVRIALCGVIGVLAGYNFFALGLPGADATLLRFGDWAASMWVLLGAVVGNTIGWYWFIYRTRDSGTT